MTALPATSPTDSLPSIDALIEGGALFVSNHSGGKDSQAMLIHLLQRVPREQLLVVHASLGDVEWPGALELARDQAAAAGVPFLVATAGKSLFEMVEHRYATRPGPGSPCWPSAANRQCTSDLKRDPIAKAVRHYARKKGLSTIVTCLGLRAQESPGRARRTTLSINARGTTRDRRWYEWLPIHGLSTEDVFRVIRDAGQEPHRAYALGNHRLSCVFCIMGSTNDLANGARHHPELLARYLEIEQRTGYTMHQSRRSLRELCGLEKEART